MPQATAELPVWDLRDLYPATNSPELAADLDRADGLARDFAAAHAGKLAAHSGAELAASITQYEAIEEILGRVMSYAQLQFSSDSTPAEVGKFYQTMSERCSAIRTQFLFFTLELNRLDDATLGDKLTDPALAHFGSWLRDLRVFRPHQLDDTIEKLLHEKDVAGASAWSRLFDETIAGLRVRLFGEDLTVSAALNHLSNPDRSKREAAGRAIGEVFTRNAKLFALITNTLAKDKEIDDNWRHYEKPWSYRNRSNMVEDEVVDALLAAVSSDFPRLSHRYYALKAKWLGLEKLQHWDRNAPLPGDADRQIPWAEARETVLGAYGAFSPELAEIGGTFFSNPWIDVPPRPGKSGGAFAHPTVPSVHPHELGHGVHQVLAAKQGYLLGSTPLTLAETASVFGEMLTFRALLNAEKDPARRRIMLASKVEDMLNTVVRQIAFYEFERRLHTQRREGEMTAEQIGEIWLDVQRTSLGPAFEFTPEYNVFWAYVPHFIHSPFYVYAYAFGDCLVNALYGVFQSGHPGFQAKYLDMLRAGGTKRHSELLAPFGLDASDPAFWRKGLDVISGFIDELEAAS